MRDLVIRRCKTEDYKALRVYADNAPAIALYEKFGFEIEGTHRRFAYRNGEYVDAHIMARLR